MTGIRNPNFYNTCAIRLSVALFGAGHQNPGKWPIKTGKYKGRAIERRSVASTSPQPVRCCPLLYYGDA